MSFYSSFKEFAVKGNVIDMAVGIIIGGAFGKIVSSLVSDIIMPITSIFTGRINLSDLALVIEASSEEAAPIMIKYGLFINNVLDFLIIALSIFFFINLINKAKAKPEEPVIEEETEREPSPEEALLTEIRDLLKDKN